MKSNKIITTSPLHLNLSNVFHCSISLNCYYWSSFPPLIIFSISSNDLPRVSTKKQMPKIAFNIQMVPNPNMQLKSPNVSTNILNTALIMNSKIHIIATTIDRQTGRIWKFPNESSSNEYKKNECVFEIGYLLWEYFDADDVWHR